MNKKFTLEESAMFFAIENICSGCSMSKNCNQICFRVREERDWVLESFLKKGYKRMKERGEIDES